MNPPSAGNMQQLFFLEKVITNGSTASEMMKDVTAAKTELSID